MKKLVRRLLWKGVIYLGLPCALLFGGYGFWMKSRLDAQLAPSNITKYSSSCSLLQPAQSQVETSLPYILRVEVRRQDGANYLPAPKGGLIHGIYDWSPSRIQWVEAAPSPEALAESVKLRRFEVFTPGQLIDSLSDHSLSDHDVHVREVASTLLVLRTGQDFGYRFDRPPESQVEAIKKWRAWWEANKVEWGTEKVLDGLKEVLKKH